jgi:uncharacterized protein
MAAHPFDDPQHYGPDGDVFCGADYSKIHVPFLTVVCTASTLHGRGGAEAFMSCPSSHKELLVLDSNYRPLMHGECMAQQIAFFDRFLKEDTSAPTFPPVRITVRTPDGGFEWREETQWPPADTEYRAYYLDATTIEGTLSTSAPASAATAAYSAEVPPNVDEPAPRLAFESRPLDEDHEIVGHVSALLWVSASASDMDVYASLRILDPSGHEVMYGDGGIETGTAIAFGALKVSHRALDTQRSTPWRPVHTHTETDYAPLTSVDEIVPIHVEMSITTARVPAGHRIQLSIEPYEGRVGIDGRAPDRPDFVAGRGYDPDYHIGATNRIHTGPGLESRLIIPLVQRKNG